MTFHHGFGFDYWQMKNPGDLNMKTTLDKFGRIVIPKKLEKILT